MGRSKFQREGPVTLSPKQTMSCPMYYSVLRYAVNLSMTGNTIPCSMDECYHVYKQPLTPSFGTGSPGCVRRIRLVPSTTVFNSVTTLVVGKGELRQITQCKGELISFKLKHFLHEFVVCQETRGRLPITLVQQHPADFVYMSGM